MGSHQKQCNFHILQVVSRFDYGGAETYVRTLSNNLAQNGCKVFVYARKGRQAELLNGNVTFLANPYRLRTIATQTIRLVYLIIRHKIRVIHAHQRRGILAASIAGFLTRTIVVVTVHGKIRHDLRSRISKRYPTRFIFVSQRVLDISKRYKQLLGKAVFINNGVAVSSMNHAHTPFQIGYSCRLDTRHMKVLNMLLDILPQLTKNIGRISLVIYGDGKALKTLRESKARIDSELGYEAVHLHGYMDDFNSLELKPELLLGVGRVAIEAATTGCSILLVNSSRLGEIVTTSNFEFYRQNNMVDIRGVPPTSNLLYNAIQGFYERRLEYRQESIRLAPLVVQNFEIGTITSSILDLYSKVYTERYGEKR